MTTVERITRSTESIEMCIKSLAQELEALKDFLESDWHNDFDKQDLAFAMTSSAVEYIQAEVKATRDYVDQLKSDVEATQDYVGDLETRLGKTTDSAEGAA